MAASSSGAVAVPSLRGVLYSVFDVEAGPVLRAQSPAGLIATDTFDSISSYIITKPDLSGKVVSLLNGAYRFVGHPMCLPGTHFRRNEFLFNLFFAIDPDADPGPFERVVRKLNNSLAILEQESSYLSSPDASRSIPWLVHSVFNKLQNTGECVLPVNEANTISLKLITPPAYKTLPMPADYEIPILLRSVMPDAQHWDLTLQRIVPFIDGVRNVQAVAERADMAIELARGALASLRAAGAVLMADPFRATNVYALTPRFHEFVQSPRLLEACRRFVFVPGAERRASALVRLLSTVCHGVSVAELAPLCRRLGVDERRLVLWGTRHGLLRRVYTYPVSRTELAAAEEAARLSARRPGLGSVSPMLDALRAPTSTAAGSTQAAPSRALSPAVPTPGPTPARSHGALTELAVEGAAPGGTPVAPTSAESAAGAAGAVQTIDLALPSTLPSSLFPSAQSLATSGTEDSQRVPSGTLVPDPPPAPPLDAELSSGGAGSASPGGRARLFMDGTHSLDELATAQGVPVEALALPPDCVLLMR